MEQSEYIPSIALIRIEIIHLKSNQNYYQHTLRFYQMSKLKNKCDYKFAKLTLLYKYIIVRALMDYLYCDKIFKQTIVV